MSYESLSKLFYKDVSNDRFENNQARADLRRQAESSYSLGVYSPEGEELFVAMPRELSVLCETVMRNERKLADVLVGLPGIARASLVRNLVISEVVGTNEIEGINSTRKQINDFLEADNHSGKSENNRRFRELAKLYLGLSESDIPERPTTPGEVRAIYDLVMEGEDLGDNAPDGVIFRKNPVEIIGSGGKVLHEGLMPENAIIDAVGSMIAFAESSEVPELISAITAHYIFEYVHPFYDGNGRTGRYLLALYLSRPLSPLTSLSLSRAIAENKAPYYRSFKETEGRLNHGEVTPFVICMAEYIVKAQESLLAELARSAAALSDVSKRLNEMAGELGLSNRQVCILYILAQRDLFAAFPDASFAEIADYLSLTKQAARPSAKTLEEQGLICVASARPLRFTLTSEGRSVLGLV